MNIEAAMINDDDVAAYRRQGFLVVNNVLSTTELDALRSELDIVVNQASAISENNDVYDLEDSHSPEQPRVRRIKAPHRVMPTVNKVMRKPELIAILTRLIGPGVRFQTSKLNMKSAGYGAPVEWHQDWAFYPHTNQDLLAVGVMLDDVDLDNGPMQVIPGSHTGPVYDHHADGYFCGAMDPTRCDCNFEDAVPLVGRAGSMTFHHVRAVHGSAPNRSGRSRNFLLYQFTAVDAWPLVQPVQDLAAYDADIVAGQPTLIARSEAVPIRMPLPPAQSAGSIYENQRTLKNRYFDTETER
ncbi:MAG: phytanoyl-CoA dioxygenase family protein [Burkholderiaceae bacterium]